MTLTAEQRMLLYNCSKDEASFQLLLTLFEEKDSQSAPISKVRLLRSVLDSIPDRIYVKDRESRFILANRATWTAHGMPDEQSLLGKTDFDLFGEGGEAYFESEQHMLATGGSIINLEHLVQTSAPAAQRAYTLISKVPLYDEQGQVIGLIGVNRDITEFKRVEEELRKNQQFSVQMTLAIPDIIYVYDLDEEAVIYCNDQITPLLGYTPEQAYAMDDQFFPALLHPEDWLQHRDLAQRYRRAQDSDIIEYEHRMQHADGSWRWLLHREMIFRRKADGSPIQLLGIANDITERKRAEEALRQSEAQKNALINAIPDMILELDANGIVLSYKPRARLISRLRPQEYIGQHLSTIYPPDLVEPMLILVRRALSTGQLQVFDYESPLVKESALREARIIAIDQTRVLVISRDVTEHKAMQQALLERERLEVALQKEQELNQLKTRMMRRISHEFRTPLSVIMASNELLWHYNGRMTSQQRQDHFARIQDEIHNMGEILKSISFILQTQAQPSTLEMKPCDLKLICDQTVQQIQSRADTFRRIDVIAEGDVCLLPADEDLIQRMLAHLLSNAVKYSPAESSISVELSRQAGEIVLRVTDLGIGIPEWDQPRLYEPFFRGSNVGETSGMGLGLALVKHVVELHDGRIDINSAVERGTTVTIVLPTSA
jgi:PAS domain S-box-containing protein